MPRMLKLPEPMHVEPLHGDSVHALTRVKFEKARDAGKNNAESNRIRVREYFLSAGNESAQALHDAIGSRPSEYLALKARSMAHHLKQAAIAKLHARRVTSETISKIHEMEHEDFVPESGVVPANQHAAALKTIRKFYARHGDSMLDKLLHAVQDKAKETRHSIPTHYEVVVSGKEPDEIRFYSLAPNARAKGLRKIPPEDVISQGYRLAFKHALGRKINISARK